MIYRKVGLFFLLSFSVFFFSCGFVPDKKAKGSSLDSIQTLWSGKKILFPSKFKILQTEVGIDSFDIFNPKTKIIAYLDAGCSACLTELHEWEKFKRNYKSNKINLIIIAYAQDEKYLKFELKKSKSNLTVLYDESLDFSHKNNFPINKQYQAMLLKKGNLVEFVGSPIYSKRITKIYYSKIDSLANINN